MEKFTQEELLQQRETIINLLRSTNRDGVERLIKFRNNPSDESWIKG